jgi:hypothetical protein
MMKSLQVAILCAMFATPLAGEAATVTYATAGGSLTADLLGTGSKAWEQVDQSKSTLLPDEAKWETSPDVLPNDVYGIAPGKVADPCMYACSPFYSGVIGKPSSDGAPGWETTSFFTVFDPKDSLTTWVQEVVLTFSRPQNALTLLWGSPDEKNVVDLLLGGKVVGSFWGKDFDWFWETDPGIYSQPGAGAALLRLSGLVFDGVRFSTWSNTGSFEFSNVTSLPAAVPLPPAVFALIAALGLGWFASRTRTEGSRPA